MSGIVQQYAMYLRNIKGLSAKTVDNYCMDLRTFFRFLKHDRGLVPKSMQLNEITVQDIDLEFIRSITTNDVFEFMNYVADERSNMSSTRQRKSSSLKSFFNYLTVHEKLLTENPTENLTPPKSKKALPHFLSLEQSIELLNAVDGPDQERDRCMLTLFLNCGMRLSELVGINISDVLRNNNTLRILGKGNKERIVYLNQACLEAINSYLAVRPKDGVIDRSALFLSSRKQRISPKTVQFIVKKYLAKIGLGGPGYSVHKLRHTAATLMYRYGDVDIRVLQDILGHENLGTTEIYTHTSDRQMEAAVNSNPLANMSLPKPQKQKKDESSKT
ncbi:tyrosine recombinase XerC [Acutalibacter muris]|nr:tyrosine recombinase XerC [Acutalibacter muris]